MTNSDKNVYARDTTPLESDWESLDAMLADIRTFCKDHPTHELLNADDPGTHYTPWRVGRIGFTAFRNITPEFAAENIRREARGEKMLDWDEQMRTWTITLGHCKLSMAADSETALALHTQRGRLALAISLRGGKPVQEVLAEFDARDRRLEADARQDPLKVESHQVGVRAGGRFQFLRDVVKRLGRLLGRHLRD